MKDTSLRVYFAKCISPSGEPIGAYKIGCSHGFNQRVKQIATNLPFTLEVVASVPGSMVLEAACHIHLRDHRVGGEYFGTSDFVEAYVAKVIERGQAFYYFKDAGTDIGCQKKQVVEAFMRFHGVSEEDVCGLLKIPASIYRTQKAQRFGTRKWIAAVGLIAASREQFVVWPQDAIGGLCGEVHHELADPEQEAA